MKALKGLLLASALSFVPVASQAAVFVIPFGVPAGTQATTETFATPPGNIVAAGYNSLAQIVLGTGADTNANVTLFGKNLGGDEEGLGLTNDPSGQNEITEGSAIRLNFSAIAAFLVPNSFEFAMNSSTNVGKPNGEAWAVFGSNSATSIGSLIANGTDDESLHTGLTIYDYYTFIETTAGGNVLLADVGATAAVPEPATWAMMLIGFLGLAGAFRMKRRIVGMA